MKYIGIFFKGIVDHLQKVRFLSGIKRVPKSVQFRSMLNAMSQDERRAMFINQQWMIETRRLLRKTADRITRVIKKLFRSEPHNTGSKKGNSAGNKFRNG